MNLLIFSLTIYFFFHIWTRSDLIARPREWILSHVPQWLAFLVTCSFCFTFHVAWLGTIALWILTGNLFFSPAILFAAPVINLVLNLVVKVLIRENEPPVIGRNKAALDLLDRWRD